MLRIYLTSSSDFPTIVSGFTYRHHRIYLLLSLDLPTLASRFTYPCLLIYLLSSWIYQPLCLDYFSKFLQKSNMVITFLFLKKNSYGDHFLILPWWSFSDVDHFLYSPFKMCFLQVRLYTHVFSQSNSHCFSKLYISTVQC